MNSSQIAKLVSDEFTAFSYEVRPGLYGKAMPEEQVAEQLSLLKAALLIPVLQPFEIRDTAAQSKSHPAIVAEYWLVVDDRAGCLVFYNEQNREFGLGCTDYSRLPETMGVCGGLVFVFMAR